MLKVALKNLFARKGRLVLSSIAIVLGVAFMSGTMVFTDTIRDTFESLVADVNEGVDAVVRTAESIEDPFQGDIHPDIDEEVRVAVGQVAGVRAAEGDVEGWAVIVDRDGDGLNVDGFGAPPLGFAWQYDEELNPLNLVTGEPPRAADDVVIDKASADETGYEVGDTVPILTQAGRGEFRLTGIARFGDVDSPLGATLSVFAPETAQRVLGTPGGWARILVVADEGVSQEEVRDRIVEELSASRTVTTPELADAGEAPADPDVEVLTGDEYVSESQDEVRRQLGFIGTLLTVFAVVALVVGAFVIYNSFSITVAQRTREMALLRAIGARRSQVVRTVLAEALVTGLLAAAVGVVAGIGLASVIRGLFSALGIDIPAGPAVVTTATVVIGISVGVVVTVLASVLPAWRASKVPPIAALRDVALGDGGRPAVRLGSGLGLLALGVTSILVGLFGDTGDDLLLVGLGALGVFFGVAVLGPVLAPPLTRVLGTVPVGYAMAGLGGLVGLAGLGLVVAGIAGGGPLPVVAGLAIIGVAWAFVPSGLGARGVQGQVGRENALRNPKRSAATASALMIGVALVAFLTVFASSLRTSFAAIIESQVEADFLVNAGFGFSGLSPELSERLAEVDGVAAVGGVRGGVVRVFEADATPGEEPTRFMSAVDPATGEQLWDLGFVEGAATDLVEGTVGIHVDRAERMGVGLGDTVDFGFLDGGRQTLRVAAFYENRELAEDYVVSLETWEANVSNQFDFIVAIALDDGVEPEQIRPALDEIVDDYPNGTLETADEFTESQAAQIQAILNLFYGLLFFAIIISGFGIANTLALSIFERTREIGLLRAVGMSRSQLRRAVRWEAAIVALMGTLLGIVVGLFLAWMIVLALRDEGAFVLSVEPVELVAVVVLGAAVGVVAALFPAMRAARLDVLDAISYE